MNQKNKPTKIIMHNKEECHFIREYIAVYSFDQKALTESLTVITN